jgi:hypothetical protein
MRATSRTATALVVALASTTACTGGVRPSPETGAVDGGGIPFGGGAGADATAGSFAVTSSAGSSSLCPGQCVDLTAQATGGVTPYAYAWDQGLEGTDGTAHACPDATTTYTVTAHDGSGMSGELTRPPAQASASVTVVVEPSCDGTGDAGTTGDAGPPVTSSGEICHVEWPQTGGLTLFDMQSATDATGDTYVAITYGSNGAGAPPLLNLGSPSPAYPAGFAIAKFDDACHLLWIREFGAGQAVPYSGADTVAIAVDAASDVTVLGDFVGTDDLGGKTFTASGDIQNGFLMRLDATGKTVFTTPIVNARVDAMTLYDLAVTPGGVSTITAFADGDTDFGNGVDLGSVLAGSSFGVVQYDATGAVVFRKPVSTITSMATELVRLATDATGALWATGWAGTGNDVQPITVGMTSSGAFSWLQQLGNSSALVAAGPHGAVEVGAAVSGTMPNETLQAFTSTGTSPWTTTTEETTTMDSALYPPQRLVIDANGDPVLGGELLGTVVSGAAPPLTAVGGHQDVDYQAFDGQGHLRSQGTWGGPDDDYLGGIGVDPAGDILIAGYTSPLASSSTTSTERFFFVKLAR